MMIVYMDITPILINIHTFVNNVLINVKNVKLLLQDSNTARIVKVILPVIIIKALANANQDKLRLILKTNIYVKGHLKHLLVIKKLQINLNYRYGLTLNCQQKILLFKNFKDKIVLIFLNDQLNHSQETLLFVI